VGEIRWQRSAERRRPLLSSSSSSSWCAPAVAVRVSRALVRAAQVQTDDHSSTQAGLETSLGAIPRFTSQHDVPRFPSSPEHNTEYFAYPGQVSEGPLSDPFFCHAADKRALTLSCLCSFLNCRPYMSLIQMPMVCTLCLQRNNFPVTGVT